MNITKDHFITINKYPLGIAIILYVIAIFVTKVLQPGMIFVIGAGFFVLLQQKYFFGRIKLAAHLWLIPAAIACLTYPLLLEAEPSGQNTGQLVLVLFLSLFPFIALITGKTDEAPSKKPRIKIVSARILVQVILFMVYTIVTAFTWIQGSKADLFYWAMLQISTAAIFPFIIGRVLCAWICPNATLQDGLIKNMNYRRPIPKLPKAIEEQSRSAAMNISGPIDKTAPLLPATLLMSWFPLFFTETIFDLTQVSLYNVVFLYGLCILSFALPWRKLCTHFCWLSSYRAMAGHGSLWRIRFNRSKCKQCKTCQPEEACPFFIDIRNQDNEMPATCCLCFSCMEACPFDGVITFRRAKEEKERLKAAG